MGGICKERGGYRALCDICPKVFVNNKKMRLDKII
jgi:hypothetical protein